MGLDATVYCNCLETGRLRTSPLPAWHVEVAEDGSRFADVAAADLSDAFDAWNETACEHPFGVAVACTLGNAAHVGHLRKVLARHPERFPRLLDQVLYSGTHCGDHIPADELGAFADELARLDDVYASDAEGGVRQFRVEFQDLLDVARELGKPISF